MIYSKNPDQFWPGFFFENSRFFSLDSCFLALDSIFYSQLLVLIHFQRVL
jgi:hypothetical protein